MQSKKFSFIESLTNVVVGYFIALISQIVIFYFYDVHLSVKTNAIMGLWFTIISIIRSYTLRRIFNRIREDLFFPSFKNIFKNKKVEVKDKTDKEKARCVESFHIIP